MRNFVNVAICTLLFLSITGIAQSTPIEDYSGEYMFTRDGNDSNDSGLKTAINDWFVDQNINYSIDLDEYAKVDAPATTDGTKLTVTYDDINSGTWEADQNVQFYSVKGANEYALYWLGEDGVSSGSWWTGHLETPNANNTPTISHLSAYNPTGYTPLSSNPAHAPEPTTMLLFGVGLLGIAGVSRRRNKSAPHIA